MTFFSKHKPQDIQSAHEKQAKKGLGMGGITFTPEEQAVLDAGVFPERSEVEDAVDG